MKFKFTTLAAIFSFATMLVSCSDDEPNPNSNSGNDNTDTPVVTTDIEGNVSGTWSKNSIINVSGHITVPEGESLTIEEGVNIIFSDNGVGINHTPIEFIVEGNLYCQGTQDNPILFSVDENLRTESNAFKGLWGGIIATEKCEEMLFDHTIIEYTGGAVLQDSPSALKGIYTPGDDFDPQITTNNVNGRYVVTNSIIRNGISDGIYMMGGKAIISNNIFVANGETGGEAINVKAGCAVDAALNIIYSPNTNGFKLSSSGQNDEAGRHQAIVRAYNNTIINAGWRRDGVKGGSIYAEKNALVSVFNNLMVNCKFRAMVPKWGTPSPDDGAALETIIDYNFYASGSQNSNLVQDIENGTTTSYLGYTTENKNYSDEIDTHSVVSSSAGDESTNPHFINFDFNNVALDNFCYDNNWDFHVSASSPVLTGAFTGNAERMTPYFTSGLNVNGTVYSSPAVQPFFGAFGAK